jgi:hypothetical protein
LLATSGERFQPIWLKCVEFHSKLAELVADPFAGALVSIQRAAPMKGETDVIC